MGSTYLKATKLISRKILRQYLHRKNPHLHNPKRSPALTPPNSTLLNRRFKVQHIEKFARELLGAATLAGFGVGGWGGGVAKEMDA